MAISNAKYELSLPTGRDLIPVEPPKSSIRRWDCAKSSIPNIPSCPFTAFLSSQSDFAKAVKVTFVAAMNQNAKRLRSARLLSHDSSCPVKRLNNSRECREQEHDHFIEGEREPHFDLQP